jgi:xylulokinase
MEPRAPVAGSIHLGLDLGTSAVKLVALKGNELVGAAGAPFPTDSTAPRQAEQHCADWLNATRAAFASLDKALAAAGLRDWRRDVQSVGLTGQLPTLVCLGARGPLGPAITWKDGRADAWAEQELDRGERAQLYARTGMPIDGRYLGPMFRFHYRARATEVSWLLSAKDYLGYALTGQAATDPSTAAGYGVFDLEAGRFDADLAARWDIPDHLLPPVKAAGDVLAPLSPEGAELTGLRAGIPVIVGAADSVSSALAMGGLEAGIVCVTMGSSTVILDAVRSARRDPAARYLVTPHALSGWYGREMDLLATGTGHDWLSRLFGWHPGELDALAAAVEPGARGLTFAPYLAGGEQGALWDPTLTGVLRGLTVRHGPADIARAFLEGVYFEIRRCVEVLAETAPVSALVVSGHFVEQPTSLQLLADVLGLPVRPVKTPSPAALGAALLARHRGQPPAGRWLEPIAGAAVAPGRGHEAFHDHYARYLAEAAR